MKKFILSVLVIFCMYILRYALYALLTIGVSGEKYFSFSTSGFLGWNAYEMMLFEAPYFQVSNSRDIDWFNCEKLTTSIEQATSHLNWEEVAPYEILLEQGDNYYKTFIKTKKSIIYIHAFPDWGGAGPSELDKNVCKVQSQIPS